MASPTDFRFTAGPQLIGYLLNSTLYGALTVQVYLYYMAFPRDQLLTKCLVYVLFLLETVQTVMILRDGFVIFVGGLSNPALLDNVELNWFSVPALTGIVGFCVQMFFTCRIYALSRSWYVPFFVCLLSLAPLITAIMSGVQSFKMKYMTRVENGSLLQMNIWLITSAACDLTIAVVMTYYLSRYKSNVRKTKALLRKLMRLTLETGSLTASVALIDVVLFMTVRGKYLYVTPSIILAKLYSNTTLAILNSRFTIAGGRDYPQETTGLVEIQFASGPQTSLGGGGAFADRMAQRRSTMTDSRVGDLAM
ncbi:hypothetical protein BDN72DRAFT_827539 [Pluteus cervinus]|uniref:Uncharacterized protein n=1 Tax=Pluteus cervinus TaxID=181527 RepID=A0ACD3AAF6_9AGAR|nr:hypothetical protein BDN72DRAFT_827539 [Pluteus cervinus]